MTEPGYRRDLYLTIIRTPEGSMVAIRSDGTPQLGHEGVKILTLGWAVQTFTNSSFHKAATGFVMANAWTGLASWGGRQRRTQTISIAGWGGSWAPRGALSGAGAEGAPA